MQMNQQRIIPRWKEWVPLATQELRLRKLIQILAINVGTEDLTGKMCKSVSNLDNTVMPLYYYTLHATPLSAPFYTSEKLESSCPKWKEIDHDVISKSGVFTATEAFVIRMWCHNLSEDNDEIITEWGVNLSGLLPLGLHFKISPPLLKPNTIIFLLPGGYYTHPKSVENCENYRHLSVSVAKEDVRLSYPVQLLTRLHSLQRKIWQRSQESLQFKEKILSGVYVTSDSRGSATLRKILNKSKSKTSHLDAEKLKKCVELERFRVQILREERNRLQDRIKATKERLEALCDQNQIVESRTMEKYRLLQREVLAHREWVNNHIEQREAHIHARALLNIRIKQLISELNCIYPVTNSENKFTICDVHLPDSESFAGFDELQLSVGLGFVAHTVQMISVFLQVPLRYPVVHFGSRSRIMDHIADKIPDKEREFPLFCKGQDKLQFNYAVYLLNKNIAQLRCLCGLGTHDLRCTLANLSSLLRIVQPEFACLSPSSSTLDLVSSFSISSPVEGFCSPHKIPTRIQRMSEPTVRSDSIGPVKHRVTKSVGSAKDFQLQPVIMPSIEHQLKVVPIANNLSYSLDKGLDEFKEITRIDVAETQPNVPFSLGGSETSLPACLSRRNSSKDPACAAEEASTSDYLKNWEAEKNSVIFSDDDSDLNNSGILVEKAINNISGETITNPNLSFPSEESVVEGDRVSLCNEVCDDAVHLTEINNRAETSPQSDPVMTNVTNRTEVLASNTSTFNTFRSRFRTNIGGTN